jgi:hypothetical protein
MLAPCKVTLADPVPARFARRATLAVLDPKENPRDLLLTCKPMVTDSCLLRSTPYPAWHRIDVSETHPVLSHAVRPNLAPPLKAVGPTLPPYMVTLRDPEATMFPRPTLLTNPVPYDKPAVMLDARRPVDIAPRRLEYTPPPIFTDTDVSDRQELRSHALCPILKPPQKPASPRPAPCTVTLNDPDAAPFEPFQTLTLPDPNDAPRVMLPAIIPTVIAIFRQSATLPPAWHRVDVSDSHVVASHLVAPTLSPTE